MLWCRLPVVKLDGCWLKQEVYVGLKHACGFAMQYHKKGLTALAFDSRGQRLVSASRDGTIALWSVFQSDSM